MQFVQYFHRNSLFFLVFLFGQTIKFVDVSTRTDDVRTGVRNSQFLHILFQPFPFSFLYGIVQNTYRTDVVRTAAYEFSLRKQVDFGTTSTHIYVHIVSVTVFHAFNVVVVYHLGFFLSVNDFNADSRFLFDAFDNIFSVLCITHGRGGTCTVVFHIVDFHQVMEHFHQTEHVLFLGFGNFPHRKYVKSQTQRDTQKKHF